MYPYQFISKNLQYQMKEETLDFRFQYKPDFNSIERTNDGYKLRIVSCTRNTLPCYPNRILSLRFNVVIRKSYLDRYLKQVANFKSFYGVEILDKIHNSKLILKDDEYIKIIVINPFLTECDMWISQTRKSKVFSSFTVPSDITLSFSDCLEIYFSMFTLRENLDDDSDFKLELPELEAF